MFSGGLHKMYAKIVSKEYVSIFNWFFSEFGITLTTNQCLASKIIIIADKIAMY